MSERDRANNWWAAILLLGITGVGFWFRWVYVRNVSFFVDEYLTVRAAYRILARGVPLLPSGNFYSHGLLLSYLEAVVVGLGGREAWILRLPVLLLSTAAIPLTYWLGRQMFKRSGAGPAAAGLVAAALLAFAPEAILWGGRVRMYASLQFFVLVTTAVFYLWVVREQDRPLYRVLFVLAYWGALFSHAEAMLLLPVWGLWALGQRGFGVPRSLRWRWWRRPANLAILGLSGLSVVVEILLRRIGPPVQALVSPGVFEPLTRQYVAAALDWPGVQKVVEPLFLTPMRLPCTLLALAGLGYLLVTGVRSRPPRSWRPRRSEGRMALAYLYALLLPVLALLLFVVDPSWKSPRYGLMLLPHFFLIAGAVLAGGVPLLLRGLERWLQPRIGFRWPRQVPPRLQWLALTAGVVLVAIGSWPSAVAATRESVPGYDWAFAYVQEHQQPGDVVITFLCPAAFLHLGRCDYLAIPADFSGFAVQKDGRWVSGWDEVPILDSADGLRQALAAAPRAWFVIDKGRFERRYEADFLQVVWNGMELVAAEREMLIFRSLSPAAHKLQATFGGAIRLLGYDLSPEPPSVLAAGSPLTVTLHWQAIAEGNRDYTVFLHLVDAAGHIQAQGDGPPLEGQYPTSFWTPGETIRDPHTLVLGPEAPAGDYRLLVGLYTLDDGVRLPVTDGPLAGEDSMWLASLSVQ